MKMMKSSMEETKIPGLYTWQQKLGLYTQFLSFKTLVDIYNK